MRRLLTSLFLCACFVQLLGQKRPPQLLKTAEIKTLVNLVDIDDRLYIQWVPLSNTSHYAGLTMLTESYISLVDGDMLIEFNLKKHKDSFYHHLALDLLKQNKEKVVPGRFDVDGDIGVLKTQLPKSQMRWKGVVEDVLEFGQRDTVLLTLRLFGKLDVDCENPPSFGLNKQWPHLAGLVAALGSYGLSRIYRGLKHDHYNQYESYWVGGRKEVDANDLFQTTQDFQLREIVYRNASLSIITVDVIWYLIRYFNYKKKDRECKLFCLDKDETVSIRPITNPSFLSNGTESMFGLKMSYKF